MGKENNPKMEAAGELRMCQAAISYNPRLATIATFLESHIRIRDVDLTLAQEVKKKFHRSEALRGFRNLKSLVASYKKSLNDS